MKAQSRTEESDLRELCSLRNSMYPESFRQRKDLGLETQKIQHHPAGCPAFFMAVVWRGLKTKHVQWHYSLALVPVASPGVGEEEWPGERCLLSAGVLEAAHLWNLAVGRHWAPVLPAGFSASPS